MHALRVATHASERAFGISAAQLFVLRQLAQVSGQSVNDVAARTRTTQSSVSEVVSRLVKRGLVARRAAPDDRRRAELSLTATGRAVLENAPETIQERLISGFGRLSATERTSLADALEAWIERSGLEDVTPPFFFEENERTKS